MTYSLPQPSVHILPLRWYRLPLLVLTLGLSCVCIAVGAQALDKSNKLEKNFKREAESTGTTIVFDMNDIKSTTIVLTTVASLLTLASLVFSTSLLFDWIRHLVKPQPKMISEERSFESSPESYEKVDQNPRRLPFSTRTLRFQTITLSFLTAWLFTILIPSTVFSRTGSAHVTVINSSSGMSITVDPLYWDYGFLRCLAAAPWFSLIFSLPAAVTSWAAWKYVPTPRTPARFRGGMICNA